MSFTPAQCRAARGLLGWSQAQLAEASKVATKTIADFERESRTPYDRTLADIQRAFEVAWVEFTNGGQPGVRLMRADAKCAKCGFIGSVRATKTSILGASPCLNGVNPGACPEFIKAVSTAHQALQTANPERAAQFASSARGADAKLRKPE